MFLRQAPQACRLIYLLPEPILLLLPEVPLVPELVPVAPVLEPPVDPVVPLMPEPLEPEVPLEPGVRSVYPGGQFTLLAAPGTGLAVDELEPGTVEPELEPVGTQSAIVPVVPVVPVELLPEVPELPELPEVPVESLVPAVPDELGVELEPLMPGDVVDDAPLPVVGELLEP